MFDHIYDSELLHHLPDKVLDIVLNVGYLGWLSTNGLDAPLLGYKHS